MFKIIALSLFVVFAAGCATRPTAAEWGAIGLPPPPAGMTWVGCYLDQRTGSVDGCRLVSEYPYGSRPYGYFNVRVSGR